MREPTSREAASADPPFSVGIFLVPGFSLVALSAVVEPLRMANQTLGRTCYAWRFIGHPAGPVTAGAGLEVSAPFDLKTAPPADLTVVVASLNAEDYAPPPVLKWLRQLHREGCTVGAVSFGPLILARAGLLDGKRATVHWEIQCAMTERFSRVEVVDALYASDRNVMTAAGGGAGMDMMLAMITGRHGAEVATAVAEQFLHGPIRPSGEMQRQGVEWRYRIRDERLAAAIRLMEERLAEPVRIGEVARAVSLSERQLERLFHRELGQGPAGFYLGVRLKAAWARVMHSSEPLARIAAATGFSSPGHFSRAFQSSFGEAPSAARRKAPNCWSSHSPFGSPSGPSPVETSPERNAAAHDDGEWQGEVGSI